MEQLALENANDYEMELILEPRGYDLSLPSLAKVTIAFAAAGMLSQLELSVREKSVIVFGDTTADFQVSINGEVVLSL